MLLDWIKANVKDGADIAEAEKLIKDLDPMKNVKTQEDALSFIDRNQLFKSALDAETSRRIDRHDDRFKADKLPDILKSERDKILKELNPEMTEEQKRIAELEARLAQKDKAEAMNTLKSKLRQKAKDLGYDPLRAEKLAVYGDEAEKMLDDEVKYFETSINTALEKKVKGQFTPQDPNRNQSDPAKVMSRADFDNKTPVQKAEWLKNGGKVTD